MQHRYSNQKKTTVPISSVSAAAHSPSLQQRPGLKSAHSPEQNPNPGQTARPQSQPQDDLARVFNTALISSQVETDRDFSAELYQITQGASFKAILSAVRHLARVQGVPERQAAEQVIQTFRKMDEIWGKYLFREGVDRLRQPRR